MSSQQVKIFQIKNINRIQSRVDFSTDTNNI